MKYPGIFSILSIIGVFSITPCAADCRCPIPKDLIGCLYTQDNQHIQCSCSPPGYEICVSNYTLINKTWVCNHADSCCVSDCSTLRDKIKELKKQPINQ